MKLNLNKPLVVFDLETTGLDIVHDRIIQLSYIKVFPNGTEERNNFLINPGCHIEAMITKLTGISDETVADKPTFKQIAKTLADIFLGCDFAGFNSNHFDIPLLAEEFLRAGIDFDFSRCRLIDAQTIFHKMERRNLAAAYKFYVGRKMEEDFDVYKAVEDDDLSPIVAWLTEHIWQYGKMYAPGALLEKCVEAPFDPQYYVDYLETKFKDLYSID